MDVPTDVADEMTEVNLFRLNSVKNSQQIDALDDATMDEFETDPFQVRTAVLNAG